MTSTAIPRQRKVKNQASPRAKKVTAQYLGRLKTSLSRMSTDEGAVQMIKMENSRLVKYLLAKAFLEKRYYPQMVEDLLRKSLAKDPTFQAYEDEDLEIKIVSHETLEFRQKDVLADKNTRRSGHSSVTGNV